MTIKRPKMRKRALMAAVGWLLTCPLSGLTVDTGDWRAASTDAVSITGDLHISAAKLTINYASFPLAQIRSLEPGEITAVFNEDNNAGGGGNLYRLDVPAEQKFIHHNTLCGTDDTQWMVTYVSGRALEVAFFSGSQMPILTVDALAHTTNLCGTYRYKR
jgi:hypothetical protein